MRKTRKQLELSKILRIFAPSKEEFAERMTTFMAQVVVSSLNYTSHHSSDVVALFILVAEVSHRAWHPVIFKKWLLYFDKNGFVVQKIEALEPSVPMFPQIIAIQPQIGLKVTVSFERIFKVKSKANKSQSIWELEITLI